MDGAFFGNFQVLVHLDEWPFNRKKAKPQNCLTRRKDHATTCDEHLIFVLAIERSSPLEKATHLTVINKF